MIVLKILIYLGLIILILIAAYSRTQDKNQLGIIAQQIKPHFPKVFKKQKRRSDGDREISDLLSVDTDQINMSYMERSGKKIKTNLKRIVMVNVILI